MLNNLPHPNFQTDNAFQIHQYLAGRMLFGTSRELLTKLQTSRPPVFNQVLALYYGIDTFELQSPVDTPAHLKRYAFVGSTAPGLGQARTLDEACEQAVIQLDLVSRLARDQAAFRQHLLEGSAANFLGAMGSYVYEPEAQNILSVIKALQPAKYRRVLCNLFDLEAKPAPLGLGMPKNRFLLAYDGRMAMEPSFVSEDEAYDFGAKVLKVTEKYTSRCEQHTSAEADLRKPPAPLSDKEPSVRELWAQYENSFCEPAAVSQMQLLCLQRPAVFNQLLSWHYDVVVYPASALDGEGAKGWFVSTLADSFPDAPQIADEATEEAAYASAVQKLGLVHLWNEDYARALRRRGLVAPLPPQAGLTDAQQLAVMIRDWWKDSQYMTTGERGERNVFDTEPDFVTKAREILGSAKGFGDLDPVTYLRT